MERSGIPRIAEQDTGHRRKELIGKHGQVLRAKGEAVNNFTLCAYRYALSTLLIAYRKYRKREMERSGIPRIAEQDTGHRRKG